MTEERLEALMLAVVEKDLLLQLSTDDLVAQFAAAADRRWTSVEHEHVDNFVTKLGLGIVKA